MSTALYPVGLVGVGLLGAYVPGEVVPPAPAPVLSLPTGTNTGPYSAIGSVVTDTAGGTLHYLTNTSPTATSASVKTAGTQPVTLVGQQDIAITGLSADTTYYNHYLHSKDGEDSAVVSSPAWETEDVPVVTGSLSITQPLKNNAGMPYVSTAYRCTIVKTSDGSLVGIKTGTTSAGAVVGTLTDAALVSGQDYFVIVEPGAGGAYGIVRVTSA